MSEQLVPSARQLGFLRLLRGGELVGPSPDYQGPEDLADPIHVYEIKQLIAADLVKSSKLPEPYEGKYESAYDGVAQDTAEKTYSLSHRYRLTLAGRDVLDKSALSYVETEVVTVIGEGDGPVQN